MRPVSAIAGLAAGAALLAGCASLSWGTANALRTLDFFNDDVAALVLALDLPDTLAPIRDGTVVTLAAVTPAHGERRIEAVLVQADTDAIAGTLPPPARDRAYYLFGFSDADKLALAEAQAWGRNLPGGFAGLGGTLSLSVRPGFCRTAQLDPLLTRISVLVALPGGERLEPLINNAPLTEILSGNAAVPQCGEDEEAEDD